MSKMNREMKKILFANTRKYVIEEGSLSNPDNVLLALTVNRNLQAYGMSLDASAIRALSTQTAMEMSKTWAEMKSIVEEVTGAEDFRGELFYRNFPEEVMGLSEAEMYLNSLFYYTFSQTNDKLSLAIADEIRNFVSQEKTDRLPLLEQFPREMKVVNKGTEKDLLKMMDARIHSLNMSESQFEELKAFSVVYKKEFNEMLASDTPFQSKETQVKLAMMLHKEHRDSEIKNLLRDGVDILRFAAMLSKENGVTQNNVELKPLGKQDIAFKLHKDEKRLIRNLLHNCKGLYEDIWKKEKYFKMLMNRLGTTEKDGCSPRVAKAFDNLASNKKLNERGEPIFNPNKLIPEAIKELNRTGDDSKLVKLVQMRPGDFMRSYVSSVEHTVPEYREKTIAAIRHCSASDKIAMKDLLTVANRVQKDIDALDKMTNENQESVRIFKVKGKKWVEGYKGSTLANHEAALMKATLAETASEMVRGYQTMGKTYIDESLRDVKAPGREMRSASGGSVLTPYSRINGTPNKNLMVFGIRWTSPDGKPGHCDVDVAVSFYGKDYERMGHIYYGDMKHPAAVFSGDYTHIPESGHALEAIVVDKQRLREMGVKYAVAEVHCYSIKSFRDAQNCRFVYEEKEGSFDNFRQTAKSRDRYDRYGRGFEQANDLISMGRDGSPIFMGEVFEPAQLENCITLNSDGTNTVPVVYDVENDQFRWLDLTINIDATIRNTVNPRVMGEVMSEIEISGNNCVPSMYDVFEAYARYNGEITQDMKEADTVFVRGNIDREELGLKEEARVITSFELDTISKEFSGNDDQSQVQEEPVVEKTEQDVAEHPLIKQLRYLHSKLEEFPRGISFHEQEGLDDQGRDRD